MTINTMMKFVRVQLFLLLSSRTILIRAGKHYCFSLTYARVFLVNKLRLNEAKLMPCVNAPH
jgi:hypothetical protein